MLVNKTYYVKTEEKEHTVKIQNKDEKFYGYDAELVENPTGTLVEKAITENGEYLPIDDDADGYSKVTVNTPIKTLIEKTITANGEYLPSEDNADGYSEVTVEVPIPVNKTVQIAEKTLVELTVDDLNGATKISEKVFSEFYKLKTVALPDSVKIIETKAFYWSYYITSFTFGNGLQTIGANACDHLDLLTNITLPSTMTSIGHRAFYDCSGLTSITILATNPPTLGSTAAFGNTNNCPIYVPAASVDAYKAATNWSSLASRIFAIQE